MIRSRRTDTRWVYYIAFTLWWTDSGNTAVQIIVHAGEYTTRVNPTAKEVLMYVCMLDKYFPFLLGLSIHSLP